MNKKVLSLLVAGLMVAPIQTSYLSNVSLAAEMAVNVDNLVDVSPSHWAYDSVKFVTQELGVLAPKTPTRFMGNDMATRYEVSKVFYNAIKKLEAKTGRNLKIASSNAPKMLSDVDSSYKEIVNSVINEYGVMQAMPGNKFMGNEKMSRYELAFELNNYLNLLEKKLAKSSLEPINKMNSLSDIKEDHWSTPAVKNIVNRYQVMSGYPDSTFKGSQNITRYEIAAVLSKFFNNVDLYFVPAPEEKPVPVPVPTPVPTPEVEPEPTPVVNNRPELKAVDLRLGGAYKVSYSDAATKQLGMLYGPSGALNIWFGKRFGLGVNGDYNMYDASFKPASLARATYGADLNLRLIADYADDVSLTIGAGWQGWNWMGQGLSYMNSGPKGKLGLEIPLGWGLSLFAEDSFTYFLANPKFSKNVEMSNDLFAGINIPAYTGFSVQLGYKEVRYKVQGMSDWNADIGGLANLRFRF